MADDRSEEGRGERDKLGAGGTDGGDKAADKKKEERRVATWTQAIDLQRHFNDILIRIRNFYFLARRSYWGRAPAVQSVQVACGPSRRST